MLQKTNRLKYSINNNAETNHLFLLQSLHDILEITNEIQTLIIDECKTFDGFVSKKVYCPATERCFSIISEATNRVYKVNSNINIENNKALIALINKPYNEIEPIEVWNIVQNDVLNLKQEIQEIISSLKHS